MAIARGGQTADQPGSQLVRCFEACFQACFRHGPVEQMRGAGRDKIRNMRGADIVDERKHRPSGRFHSVGKRIDHGERAIDLKAAQIDQRRPRKAAKITAFCPIETARCHRLPARSTGQQRQFVTLGKGKNEQRKGVSLFFRRGKPSATIILSRGSGFRHNRVRTPAKKTGWRQKVAPVTRIA